MMTKEDRIRDLGEVFTPVKTVQEMISAIPDEAWSNPDYTILEPTAGEGAFVIEVIKKRLSLNLDIETIINNIFALDIMADNIQICRLEVKKLAHTAVKDQLEQGKIDIREAEKKYSRILCIIENNIRTTEDTLKEDFSKIYFWYELPRETIEPQYNETLKKVKKAKMFV